MERRAINPWTWQQQFGFVQANEVRQPQRILFVSGQTSLDAAASVAAVGDMRGQVVAALDNLETVLRQAEMSFANLVRLTFYATDMDRFLAEAPEVLAQRLAGVEYATTYLGVTRLAMPDLLIEIEATAVA
jgi:enamine deaminase RidA (YjgF/YER057c/UK114 family)